MFDGLLFALLFVAAALGYGFGRWRAGISKAARAESAQSAWLQQRYFEGLNHVLNEQPDAAIEAFISTLQVNSETLETHFALGNLLRKRGEVDRAIRIHQNLLARPSLDKTQLQQVQIELATDYMKSGLLDRAEALFKDLVASTNVNIRRTSLRNLVEIYQGEREWELAIAAAEQLCHRKFSGETGQWRLLQSHYCCELAERAMQKKEWQDARGWLRQAHSYCRESVRANLMLGRLELLLQNPNEALKVLKKIPTQNPIYVGEALPLISQCYQRLGNPEGLQVYLSELYQGMPSEAMLPAMANVIYKQHGDKAAVDFLIGELGGFPSTQTHAQLLDLCSKPDYPFCYPDLLPLIEGDIRARQAYQCVQCGFHGQQLHWSCPGCKAWETIRQKV